MRATDTRMDLIARGVAGNRPADLEAAAAAVRGLLLRLRMALPARRTRRVREPLEDRIREEVDPGPQAAPPPRSLPFATNWMR